MEYIVLFVIGYFIYRVFRKKKRTKVQSAKVSRKKINSPVSSQEEDFTLFQLDVGSTGSIEKTSNKAKGVWLPYGEKVKIRGRQLETGLIYYGGTLTGLNSSYHIEPSLVDEKRPASKPNPSGLTAPIYEDSSLGYWPSYASLSEPCRGVYLDWLASDRCHPDMPIGYVFIYFYGLERYFLENSANGFIKDEEILIIYKEVTRLREIYGKNRSFRGYSGALLEYMYLCNQQKLESEGILPDSMGLIFRLELALKVSKEKPIPADLALLWLENSPDYTLKVPARRCSDEFKKLFLIRYAEKFGEGIKVKANKKALKLEYHAASSTNPSVWMPLDDLCDPFLLKGPINKLIPIAEACTEELKTYSRYMARQDSSPDDVDALILLPDILIDGQAFVVIKTFQEWANRMIKDHQGVVKFEHLWANIGKDIPARLTQKDNHIITQFVAKAGFGLAPDFRYHPDKIKQDGKIVLYAPAPGAFFEPSQEFKQICISIKLGSIIALADGHLDPSEARLLSNLVDHNDHISPSEKASLNAYLRWSLNTDMSLNGLKAQFKMLNTQELEILRHLIISVALTDGKADKEEIKKLEKLYLALGLDTALVSSDIHHLASSKIGRILTQENTAEASFALDKKILKEYEDETNHAQAMLQSVFSNQTEIEEEIPVTVAETQPKGISNTLDQPHHDFYHQLITKEKWMRDDLISLCQKLNLMLDAAMETVNDWAFDIVDAPVLDDDGTHIYVDFEIVEELRG